VARRCAFLSLIAAACLVGCHLRAVKSPTANSQDEALNGTVAKLLTTAAAAQEEGDPGKLEAALTALSGLGEEAIPPLAAAHSDPDGNVRLSAVQALARIKTPAVVAPLLAALKDDSSQVRTETVRALGELRVRSAVQPLLEQFRTDDTPSVRYDCLTSLGQIGDPAARPLLLDGTHDHDRYVRMWSMTALCDMHDMQAADLAPVLARDPEVYVRRQVLIGCEQALDTPRGHAALIELALADDLVTSSLARRNLNNYRQQGPAGEGLTEQMRGAGRAALKKSPHSVNAALLLGELRDAAAVQALIAALRNPNYLVRGLAAQNLGEIGEPRAVPALIKTLDDPQAQVAALAYVALQRFSRDGNARAKAATEIFEKKRGAKQRTP